MPSRPLTPRQQRFVEEYLVDLCAKAAATRAGYSAKTAEQQGYQLLQHPSVSAAVAKLAHKRSEKTGITSERVLEALAATAFGDVSKLIEYRRVCCRWCHGKGHKRQETAGERDRRRLSLVEENERRRNERDEDGDTDREPLPPLEWDDEGGIGWDPRVDPHPECPECWGEGHGEVFLHDTRKMDADARALYAGVKQTKDGISVNVNSQDHARELLGKHLKLFADRTELTGPGGAPITIVIDTGIPPTAPKVEPVPAIIVTPA